MLTSRIVGVIVPIKRRPHHEISIAGRKRVALDVGGPVIMNVVIAG
jgi:hypothetical protein